MFKMKIFSIILVSIVFILVAGCTSSDTSTQQVPLTTPPTVAETPQQAQVASLTPTPIKSGYVYNASKGAYEYVAGEPVLGVWRYAGDKEFRIEFNADGSVQETFSDNPSVILYGSWRSAGDNAYIVSAGSTRGLWTYTPSSNTLYEEEYPSLIYSPYSGSVAFSTEAQSGSASPASNSATSSGSSSDSGTILRGNGDDVVSFTASGTGLRVFTMTHSGDSNFIVWLEDSGGDRLDLVVNEIGSYSGKKSEKLSTGTYYLDITADGPWTIKITSP